MAQVRFAISIDEDLLPVIGKLAETENRNPSNMTETLIREALRGRDEQETQPQPQTQEESAA